MTQTYLEMLRRGAVAWSDYILAATQRWNDARDRILDERKGYEMKDLTRDVFGTWMAGLQALEQAWMPVQTRGGTPIVFLKGPNLDADLAIDPPFRKLKVQATDLAHAGNAAPIPKEDVSFSPTDDGVLKIQLKRKPYAPGLYRGLVHGDQSGTAKVLAELVVELPIKQD
jgi:hypothetical protein